jgi:hypothetical protein
LGLLNIVKAFFFGEKRFFVKIIRKFFIFNVVAIGDGKYVLLTNKKWRKNDFKISPRDRIRAETNYFNTKNVFCLFKKFLVIKKKTKTARGKNVFIIQIKFQTRVVV